MKTPLVRISLLLAVSIALVACAEDESATTSSPETTVASTTDSAVEASTTTVEAPTFCGTAELYATEVVNALDNQVNQSAEDSAMNTRAFWERYKELQTQMLELAPEEIKADAVISHESAMAAYDYMEQFEFSMKLAADDPSFTNDERFTGEKYLKAGAAFEGYINDECGIQLVK